MREHYKEILEKTGEEEIMLGFLKGSGCVDMVFKNWNTITTRRSKLLWRKKLWKSYGQRLFASRELETTKRTRYSVLMLIGKWLQLCSL